MKKCSLRSKRVGNSRRTACLLVVTGCVVLASASLSQTEPKLDSLVLPTGFEVDFYTQEVPGARSLARSESGVVYVGTQRAGKVYAVVDQDGDHRAERVYTVAEGLTQPNGVAIRDGSLYVAEIHRLLRFDRIDERLESPPEPVVIYDDLPNTRWHGWKFIRFGPDGRLYVPVGAPCNVCDSEEPFHSLLRMKADGSEREVFAHGIRNTVGFDWHPVTQELWFTDNGRDNLGDDVPPDELNHAPKPGLHFGFPFCHGADIVDPEFGDRGDCADIEAPAMLLAPHTAAIGMRFYTGKQFPERYHGQIFIAEHGSWNRSDPIGYRVTVVHLGDDGRPSDYEVFASGWLEGRSRWGRPVDVEVLADGSLLVSDDMQGAIYRIHYAGAASSDAPSGL